VTTCAHTHGGIADRASAREWAPPARKGHASLREERSPSAFKGSPSSEHQHGAAVRTRDIGTESDQEHG
jgi:hypothetical protein